ncbi:hypothetical protein ACEQ6A_00130 [Rhizobium brockwellii]|uniref:hypothetical protein n=1 Tax=Rhizobium brockwellii TaxID=3019932 RepID=UPI003F96A242
MVTSWACAIAGIGKLPVTAAAETNPAPFRKRLRVVDGNCFKNIIEFLPVDRSTSPDRRLLHETTDQAFNAAIRSAIPATIRLAELIRGRTYA